MKRFKYILLSSVFMLFMLCFTNSVSAQDPPHPPQTGHGAKGDQNANGSAPLDGGVGILLALSLAYGSRKAVHTNNRKTM